MLFHCLPGYSLSSFSLRSFSLCTLFIIIPFSYTSSLVMCDIPTRWLLGDGAMGKKRLDSVGFVLPTGMLTKGEQPTERTVPPGGQADSPVRGDPHQG